MNIVRLFRRDSDVIGVCCNCGQPIRSAQGWVTIVAAPYASLRSHRGCHLGSQQDAALEWPEKIATSAARPSVEDPGSNAQGPAR